MTDRYEATGEFEVTLMPLDGHVRGTAETVLGRLSIDKTFRGGLEATSRGEMLSVRTSVASSAGYVAIEQVTGTLGGRTGSFVLQHFGIMHGGANRLVLEVVPDSGTGELVGLAGTMRIEVVEGSHQYVFDYAFA